ncbi:hypothetical protein [Ferrimonas marina]|uniref:Uncharacterized protein n=1 Tax=Ferrimonas marina TaxID=299255 RepID=A0A1M5U9N3_9GAMM|nr:hypothetical protein [Ferrimonas marina]SHH59765.1 hypothetical protein SAMN02745129_2470 [Ferrimonas marina]
MNKKDFRPMPEWLRHQVQQMPDLAPTSRGIQVTHKPGSNALTLEPGSMVQSESLAEQLQGMKKILEGKL